MSTHVCRCCAWQVIVPEKIGADDLALCSECGQVLHVPPPWSDKDIPLCDTQPLARFSLAELEQAPGDRPRPLVPAELSVCRVRPLESRAAGMMNEGVVGIVLGVLLIAGAAWSAVQGGNEAWLGPIGVCAGLLLCLGGGVLVRSGRRRSRKVTAARVVSLSAFIPADGYDLGTPLSYHRPLHGWKSVGAIMSGLVFLAGVAGLVAISHGARHSRLFELIALAIPGGLVGMVRSLRLRNQRVLVCPKGLMVNCGSRTDVWRWDTIDAIWLKPEPALKPLTAFTCRLRREDGEEWVLNPRTDFMENQVCVRAQAEVAARLLPQWRRTLQFGATVDFGVFELSAEGLCKSGQHLPFEQIADLRLDAEYLMLRTTDRQNYRWPIARVPNLTALLTLLRERRLATRTGTTGVAATASR